MQLESTQGSFRESALSRAISSYTPSLRFLMHYKRKAQMDRASTHMQRFHARRKLDLLIVTMPSTPGMKDLKGLEQEAKRIKEIVESSYSVQHKCQPSADEIKECMKNCEVVHFACHGLSVLTNPLSSQLLLQTKDAESEMLEINKLTVKDVITLNLSHGKLAFLSACSSAENRYQGLLDESLHLMAGFGITGYLQAIGNLWPADDDISVEVVEAFYRHLLKAGEFGNGENVAEALNKALLDVLASWGRQPLAWAQYVHFGI